MNDQIYLDGTFKLQASQKAKGLKGYYIEAGEIKPITVSTCVNRWGTIYLMTDAQYERAKKMEAKVAELKSIWERQMKLANELLESDIVNNIINQ